MRCSQPEVDKTVEFQQQRPRLFSIAYRMLGTRADAEDILQECWLRWHHLQEPVRSTPALLATITTRLCLDHLRGREQERKAYIGPWLPEPLAARHAGLLTDGLSYSMHVLLEALSPQERCVFLLREVIGFEYDEIAAVLETSAAHCRKLLERARTHLAAGRRQPVSREAHRALLERFLSACTTGDVNGLRDLLTADAMLRSDGGGKAAAALNPIHGADRVARFFAGVSAKQPPGLWARIAEWCGEPVLETWVDGRLVGLFLIVPAEDRIAELFAIRNPDKLPQP